MMHATPNGAHLRGLRLATYAPQNMRHLFGSRWRPNVKITLRSGTPVYHQPPRHISFFPPRPEPESRVRFTRVASVIIAFILLKYWLYPTDELQHLQTRSNLTNKPSQPAPPQRNSGNAKANVKPGNSTSYSDEDEGILSRWAKTWESISISESADSLSDKVVDLILPEWTKSIPGMIRKLQRELIMAPDSLAAEIWEEAHDPYIHPEIKWEARVRVSGDLCEEEKTYLERRRKVIAPALANYLGLKEEDIHPDDIPTIAICGSGGGLRALVAGTGSFLATTEDGLFDCVTYASGVSGSCWLQSLFYSSVTGNNFRRGIDHLKARLGTHIADPPTAFASLTSAPTNKYLLSGMVEKFKGNSSAEFSLVDVYGVLLAARLLVPKGELGVSEKDFKLSNQRDYVRFGQNPLPIYTAVRHEIPEVHDTEADTGPASEEAKERAKREAWFQWFEITPYEFFCEEFSAGIPTWALGRKFKDGRDVPSGSGLRLPEVRMPLLLGIWGSAFCATLSHYYREIRPLVRSIAGFSTVDEMIWGLNEDLSKVHPIDPASIPNPIYGMHGKLPGTVPETAYDNENIQLMDAGMSNNLPIYPLLRPGRDVDVIISFDASADIKTDNWLSVVEGYAIQRGIKGWPLGIGWPKPTASPTTTAKQLDQAESSSSVIEAEEKVNEAKEEHATRQQAEAAAAQDKNQNAMTEAEKHEEAAEELGYCTVWVGTTQERSADPPPPPKPIDDTSSWKLSEPDAGIAVVYLPFLANEDKVPGVDPASNEHMSTWNFVYTPKQIDDVVALAKANYAEGKDQIRATVRAVYERKKKKRLERRRKEKEVRFRRLVRLGKVGKFDQGEQGDHFS